MFTVLITPAKPTKPDRGNLVSRGEAARLSESAARQCPAYVGSEELRRAVQRRLSEQPVRDDNGDMACQPINQQAGRVLAAVLGGRVVPRDVPGANPGTHDFDLKLGDGRTFAVEVTISTDRRTVEFWHAVHEEPWDASSLRDSWLLNVTPPARVKTLRDSVETLLQKLEEVGITKFGLLPGVVVKTPEIDRLHRLHVKSGGVLPVHPSRIFIVHTGAGFMSTEPVREAIEQEANKSDNRAKLGRATADERHLFVWVDPLGSPAAPATRFMGIVLPAACNLPPEIDVAWVAIPTVDDAGNSGQHVWRCDRQNGWQDIGRR